MVPVAGNKDRIRIAGFSPAFAALVLLCLGILPVSAAVIAPEISQGAIVYIGEEGLNLTHALNQAHGAADIDGVPGNLKIGWWASAQIVDAGSPPIKTVNLSSDYRSFSVRQSDFVGYTGNWYLMDNITNHVDLSNGGLPQVVLVISDPQLALDIWDFDQGTPVSGKSVPPGEHIGFRIWTNMYNAIDERYRSPVTHTTADGYIDIRVRNPSGVTLMDLATGPGEMVSLEHQLVNTEPWLWPSVDGAAYWKTNTTDGGNTSLYPPGIYSVWAESALNNMRINYRNAGADYTGKTVSQISTITLSTVSLNLETNHNPVRRGDRFSLVITGKPSAEYYLWVKDDGPPPVPVTISEYTPSILPSAPVIQDSPSGPFTIGSYPVQDGSGKTLRDAVPVSIDDRTRHYAAIMTDTSGRAVVEIQTWNDTSSALQPNEYTFRAEGGSLSAETTVNMYGSSPNISPDTVDPAMVIRDYRINTEIETPDGSDYRQIEQGAVVFIGEEGLNITRALNQAHGDGATPWRIPVNTRIGWWASAAAIPATSPTKTIDVASRHSSFQVAPGDFVGYSGNWYLIDNLTGTADMTVGETPRCVFTVADPALSLSIRNFDHDTDVTGQAIPLGERLTFAISTNMYQAALSRPDVSPASPGFISIKVKDENGAVNNFLYQDNATAHSLTGQYIDSRPFFWKTGDRSATAYWETGILGSEYLPYYPAGTYSVWAESTLNNMKHNYKNAGADYSGKTVSTTATVSLVPAGLSIESNKASVGRDSRFSVTISGRLSTTYYLWVMKNGNATPPVNPFLGHGDPGSPDRTVYHRLAPSPQWQRQHNPGSPPGINTECNELLCRNCHQRTGHSDG